MTTRIEKYRAELERADLRSVRDAVSDYEDKRRDLKIEFDYKLNNLRKKRDAVVREAHRAGATKAELGRAMGTRDFDTLVRILTGE